MRGVGSDIRRFPAGSAGRAGVWVVALVGFDDSDGVGEGMVGLLSTLHAQECGYEGGGKHKSVEGRSELDLRASTGYRAGIKA